MTINISKYFTVWSTFNKFCLLDILLHVFAWYLYGRLSCSLCHHADMMEGARVIRNRQTGVFTVLWQFLPKYEHWTPLMVFCFSLSIAVLGSRMYLLHSLCIVCYKSWLHVILHLINYEDFGRVTFVAHLLRWELLITSFYATWSAYIYSLPF